MSVEDSIRTSLNNEWVISEQQWMEAMLIKKWRTGGATWRRIADFAAIIWPDRGYDAGNQLEGRELCQQAAITLDEDYREWDEWHQGKRL